MCGRYVSPDEAAIERAWNLTRGVDPFSARYNAAPTDGLPVVRVRHDKREIARLRWGLIPYWAKEASIGVKAINARAETLAEKPAFRDAFERRRCIVPMRGFYEWKKAGRGKIPHFCRLTHADLFGVAGLYEYWPGVEGSSPMETFTVITTDANELLAELHNRMPAILSERDYEVWLDPVNRDTVSLKPILKPYPAEEMRVYPVSTKVNRVENDDDSLIREVGGPEQDLFGAVR